MGTVVALFPDVNRFTRNPKRTNRLYPDGTVVPVQNPSVDVIIIHIIVYLYLPQQQLAIRLP